MQVPGFIFFWGNSISSPDDQISSDFFPVGGRGGGKNLKYTAVCILPLFIKEDYITVGRNVERVKVFVSV